MKIFARIMVFAVIIAAATAAGDVTLFVDLPSIMFTFLITFFVMMARYGKGLFSYFLINEEARSEMAEFGILSSLLTGVLGAFVGFVIILQNLSDPSALGPAMAVSLLTIFYNLFLTLVLFLPDVKSVSNIKGRLAGMVTLSVITFYGMNELLFNAIKEIN